ncbi:MAG: prolyl oligopeptidase family serine peptidase [Brachybacterium tyrofermentans]|uniref:S9 family peptidase n=2 Tax=Brachybacterium tyrofermentans TaxID=47848 RepID=UPI0018686E5C|nr:S9 family peptidase [Brachybacterium tyrofermentans]
MVTTLPYGSWPSPISAELLATGGTRLGAPQLVGDAVWWTEGIATEGGRLAIVRSAGPVALPSVDDGPAPMDGPSTDPVTVLPAPFNARSRVHEYGGTSWTAVPGAEASASPGGAGDTASPGGAETSASPGGAGDPPLVVFVNFEDQRVHAFHEGEQPRPLSPVGPEVASAQGPSLRWADPTPVRLADGTDEVWWVCEDHTGGEQGPRSGADGAPHIERYIAAVPLDGSAAEDPSAIRRVTPASRFVAHPRVSPDASQIAWISWEHPRMPWDGTELHVAPLLGGSAGEGRIVLGDAETSVLQPEWLDDQRLLAISDASGWWNPWVWTTDDGAQQVLELDQEFAGSMWSLGTTWFQVLDADTVLVRYGRAADGLGILRIGTGDLQPLDCPLTSIAGMQLRGDGLLVLAGSSPTQFAAIGVARLDLARGASAVPTDAAAAARPAVPAAASPADPSAAARPAAPAAAQPAAPAAASPADPSAAARPAAPADASPADPSAVLSPLTLVRSSRSDAPDPAVLPTSESIEVPLRNDPDGGVVHAIVHRPHQEGLAGREGDLPPFIARVHGGPTGHVSPVLHLPTAYYTSRGLGVVDVNYGGSTGYGRAYRNRLRGQWGVVDVEDTVAVMEHLVAEGIADPGRIAIEGGSAGGWTTLACLTRTNTFAAGASSFGVAELEKFRLDTHDFESRYIDGLVGPYPERKDLYVERAPLHHVDELEVPVLLLQGDEDRIVPPSQSELFRDALAAKGIPHAYLLFEGEQHGFRKASSIIRAAEATLSFYGQVLGFSPPCVPVLELERG